MSDDYQEGLLRLFEEHFNAYQLPFRSANAEIALLDSEAKTKFTEDAGHLLKSDLWRIEAGELYRSLFHQLAFSVITDEERTAYRLMIMFLDRWESRLIQISKMKNAVELAALIDNPK